MSIALAIAVVGLLITSLVSWFFELTDKGWVRESTRSKPLHEGVTSWIQHRRVDYIIIGSLAAALLLSLYSNASSSNELERTRALARVEVLVDQDRYVAAYKLTETLSEYGVDELRIAKLVASLTNSIDVTTVPAGAAVHVRALGRDAEPEWRYLGETPISDRVLAKGIYEWRFTKEGFSEATRIERNPGFLVGGRDIGDVGDSSFLPELKVRLTKTADHSIETVAVPGGSTFATPYAGMEGLAVKDVAAFEIAKYEITNEQYMRFVAAGGYTDASLWPAEVQRPGDDHPLESIAAQFVDSTGRPGPSTWSYGKFAADTDKHPVSGISWFEAHAYAKFIGGSLPTVYQFGSAAFSSNEVNAPLRPLMIKGSNFSSSSLWPTQTQSALGPYGTFDMLGNVREWTANGQGKTSLKYVLGGSWLGPAYSTMAANRLDAWDRSPANGLRVVFNSDAARVDTAPIDLFAQFAVDHMISPTVSDEEFESFRWAFDTPNVPLEPAHEETLVSQHWTRKQTSIAVGQGNERMSIYLYLPNNAQAPYQPIIYFPGYTAFAPETISQESVDREFPFPDFVPRGGRALVFPVFTGAYERYDGHLALDSKQRRQNQVTRRLAWIREIGRVIDYLEMDSEFNASQVGYLGISFGAARPLPVLAVEPRLKAAILISGGISLFDYDHDIPAIGAVMNYVVRTKLPTLMVNGRYDNVVMPTQQEPLFTRLGTPPEHKKWVQYDAGHWPFPENQMVSEVLGWMDKYLGKTSGVESAVSAR